MIPILIATAVAGAAIPNVAITTTQPPKSAAAAPAVHAPVAPNPKPSARVVARIAAANHAATLEPQVQGFVNGAQIYPFSDGAIYRIYVAPGAVTDIALQPGETLVAVAAGDTARWVIGDTTSGTGTEKRTHVLVKPFAAGLSTNLVITTDRRTYHVLLTATTRTAMAALSWTYPGGDLIALARSDAPKPEPTAVASGLSLDDLRFDYAISGDTPSWRPIRAFDDGRQTFIEFPPTISTGEAPPFFVIGPTGDAELVNYRMRGRYYVADRLFDVAELRLGTKKQQIVRISRLGASAKSGRGGRS